MLLVFVAFGPRTAIFTCRQIFEALRAWRHRRAIARDAVVGTDPFVSEGATVTPETMGGAPCTRHGALPEGLRPVVRKGFSGLPFS